MNVLVINEVDPAEDSLLQQLQRFKCIHEIRYVNSYLDTTPSLITEDIQLIFMDTSTPHQNWLEASTYIHALCPSLPIILVSSDDHLADQAFHNGICDYLITPVSTDSLSRVISKLTE